MIFLHDDVMMWKHFLYYKEPEVQSFDQLLLAWTRLKKQKTNEFLVI